MHYYCEVCNMFIKPKSKSKHFKSKNHIHLDKQKHIQITIDNPDINNIDEFFYSHINEYNNKYEFYPVRCEFNVGLLNMDHFDLASSELTENRTRVSWKILVENAINNLRKEGFFSAIYLK